jgi:hypothetical protein
MRGSSTTAAGRGESHRRTGAGAAEPASSVDQVALRVRLCVRVTHNGAVLACFRAGSKPALIMSETF